MSQEQNEINALKQALQPIRDQFYDETGLAIECDPKVIMQKITQVVQIHKKAGATIAAISMYAFHKKYWTDKLVLIDPNRRPIFSKILPTKRITIRNTKHLISIYSLVLDNPIDSRLCSMLSSFIFMVLFFRNMQDTSEREVIAMGHVVTWHIYDLVNEIVSMANDL